MKAYPSFDGVYVCRYDNFVDRRNFGVYISAAKYKIKRKNSDITGLPDPSPPE